MSEIIPFQFEAHDVRVVMVDGEPWFIGRDVAEVLGYLDTVNALKQHCRGVVKYHPIVDSLGRQQEARIISQPDMLRLIVGSKLPSAVRFERWVFEDVLPSVLKTGSYALPQATPSPRIPAHEADRIVAASRTFNALMRAGRHVRQPLPVMIRRAAEVAERETGVDLLDKLDAHDHLAQMEAQATFTGRQVAHPSVTAFWAAWSCGLPDLPCQSCLTAQAYQAYVHWCDLEHEGHIIRREKFTTALLHAARDAGRHAQVTVMRIGVREQSTTQRMLLLTAPPFEAQGAWATGLVAQFAEHLRRFMAQQREVVA